MTLLCNRYSNTEILARHKQYFLFNNNISDIGDRPCCLTSQVFFYLIVIISAIIYYMKTEKTKLTRTSYSVSVYLFTFSTEAKLELKQKFWIKVSCLYPAVGKPSRKCVNQKNGCFVRFKISNCRSIELGRPAKIFLISQNCRTWKREIDNWYHYRVIRFPRHVHVYNRDHVCWAVWVPAEKNIHI